MQEQYSKFQEISVNWIAITTDDPQKVLEMRNNLGITSFPVLLDPEGKVAHQYGTIWWEERGCSQPAVYVVRHNRKLEFQGMVSGPRGRPPVDDILIQIQRNTERNTWASDA